jgi:hypothetical protein
VDTTSRFAEALDAESTARSGDPDLLPVRLARAAAAVLPVDGVGLSIHRGPDLRTPLAASSAVASLAESLQFTAGAGPCLLAAETRYPVFATEGSMARRWPVFHDLLVPRTPLRSVLALCLPDPLRGVAGMDLFSTDPDGAATIDVFQARLVAGLVAERLGPAGDCERVREGHVEGGHDQAGLLRAHAYATDRTADDLAADLVGPPDRPRGVARGRRQRPVSADDGDPGTAPRPVTAPLSRRHPPASQQPTTAPPTRRAHGPDREPCRPGVRSPGRPPARRRGCSPRSGS